METPTRNESSARSVMNILIGSSSDPPPASTQFSCRQIRDVEALERGTEDAPIPRGVKSEPPRPRRGLSLLAGFCEQGELRKILIGRRDRIVERVAGLAEAVVPFPDRRHHAGE